MERPEPKAELLGPAPTSKDPPKHSHLEAEATRPLGVEEVALRAAPAAALEEAEEEAREVLLDLARKKHKKRE